jgi:putative ATP-binding cassette transporter
MLFSQPAGEPLCHSLMVNINKGMVKQEMSKAKVRMRMNALKLARGYWWSEEKWRAWFLLITVITLNLGLVYISVRINVWQSIFYQVIQNYNEAGFRKALCEFGVLAVCYTVLRGYQLHLRMLLHARWRRWMTKCYLDTWLGNQTYYRLQLAAGDEPDNPDQRLSEDIELFVTLTLRLTLDLLQDIVTILSFVFILWQLSGIIILPIGPYSIPIYGYLVWAAISYAFVGTCLTIKLGYPLVKLDFDQQRYEADFRFSLMRLRENAESIALYGGEKTERQNFGERYIRIFTNFLDIAKMRKRLMWLTTGYSEISIIFAIMVASPRYFQGIIHLGHMFQIIDAYNRVQTGFSFAIDSFTRIAQWRAVVNRLNNFLLSMDLARTSLVEDSKFRVIRSTKPTYAAKSLTVYLPNGQSLLRHFNLSLKYGERLLIAGPSGCGKSTLLRALAGIWPYAEGELILPAKDEVMFVPQKAYLPLSSLRGALLYPWLPKNIKDSTIEAVLNACKIAYLGEKLDVYENWGQVLSLGEQQRVAFAQVLFHKPRWLFLDEATSALDEPTEREIYTLIREQLPQASIVSVGHRQTLVEHHLTKLELDLAGNWDIQKITAPFKRQGVK